MVLICKTFSTLHPRMLYARFGWNWPSCSDKDVKISSMYLLSPLGKGGPFIWRNVNPLIQGCFVSSLVEIGSVVLEKNIFKFHWCIFAISYLFLLGKGDGPSFEQTWIYPLPKNALCQVWLKLTQWFLRRRFLNFVNVFHYFIISSISPLKRVWPFIWTNFKSLHPRMLCAKLSWNWSASREKDENMKRLQTDGQTDRRTDNRRSKKLTWAFSSGEIKNHRK